MESLLSLSFSNLSSRDTIKIRKGLRQIEGLLAQICLSSNPSATARRRSTTTTTTTSTATTPNPPTSQSQTKSLVDLRTDPAFREFFRLQDSFEYNVSSHLLTTIERLLSHPPTSTHDTLIHSALTLLQGLLLLHPPSRSLFAREDYMILLLDLLPPPSPPPVQRTTLHVLVAALLHRPGNARAFERAGGLEGVTGLFKARATDRGVKCKVVEFLYFYLLDETPHRPARGVARADGAGADDAVCGGGEGRDFAEGGAGRRGGGAGGEGDGVVRSVREKQRLLGRYLSNVGDLVQDLRESGGVFGDGVGR